jgi:hypothetical protein
MDRSMSIFEKANRTDCNVYWGISLPVYLTCPISVYFDLQDETEIKYKIYAKIVKRCCNAIMKVLHNEEELS